MYAGLKIAEPILLGSLPDHVSGNVIHPQLRALGLGTRLGEAETDCQKTEQFF